MEIWIASDQERPHVFAEVHDEGGVWAEVYYDSDQGKYLLTIFPPGSCPDPSEFMCFDFDEAMAGLQRAQDVLIDRGFPGPSGGADT